MNPRLFVWLALSLSAFAVIPCHESEARQASEDKNGVLVSPSTARSPEEFAARIGKLVLTCPTSDLKRLATGPDCDTALAAGWELVCRTVPNALEGELVTPDARATSRFLGLLEGRVQFPIPDEWEAAVKSAKRHPPRNFRFAGPALGRSRFLGTDF